MKAKILLINGSPNGNNGQSHTIANAIMRSSSHDFRLITLATQNELKQWQAWPVDRSDVTCPWLDPNSID